MCILRRSALASPHTTCRLIVLVLWTLAACTGLTDRATTETRTVMLTEHARVVTSPDLAALYKATVGRVSRRGRNIETIASARDLAIGDATPSAGEQAAASRRSGESIGQRISAHDARWEARERPSEDELQQRRVMTGAGVLFAVLSVLAGMGTVSRSRVAFEEVKAGDSGPREGEASTNAARQRADDAFQLARRARDAAELAAARTSDMRVRDEITRIWAALDQRDSHSVMLMSDADRTRVLAPQPTLTSASDLVVQVFDDAGEHTLRIGVGMAVYIGRDDAVIQVVARRYLIPHSSYALREQAVQSTVSRCHCSVVNRGGRMEIVDLSTNGTWLDGSGERLSFGEARSLDAGATLRLASPDSPYRVVLLASARPASPGTTAAPTVHLN